MKVTASTDDKTTEIASDEIVTDAPKPDATGDVTDDAPEEVGGRGGLDPTRYGDWEKNGRCIDF